MAIFVVWTRESQEETQADFQEETQEDFQEETHEEKIFYWIAPLGIGTRGIRRRELGENGLGPPSGHELGEST